MISIIVATAENRAIGRDNKLLWHISEDLKYFKKITSGHTVVMGRNTFLSIGSKPLPNRRNIVVSGTLEEKEGVEVFSSFDSAASAAIQTDEEVFVIGGGMVYRAALPIADRLYVTEVMTVIEDADTFFPVIDGNEWRELSRSERQHDEETGYDFFFVVYDRNRNIITK